MTGSRRFSSVLRVAAALAAASACAILPPAVLGAQGGDGPQPEYRVKAKILRSFASYVEWPESAFDASGSPFVICIFGADPFGAEIDRAVEGSFAAERPLALRRLGHLEEARGCHIVFISRAERHRQAAILAGLEGRPILTVGESDWFIEDGGGIRLAVGKNEDGKTTAHFEINLAVLHQVGLEARLQLQRLAAAVYR